jgi:hypothetical protein
VTSISPATDLNQLGGDILTIVGKGFDSDFTNTEVKFSDNTKCTVITSAPEKLTCTADGFDAAALNTASPYATTISVNSVTNNAKTV